MKVLRLDRLKTLDLRMQVLELHEGFGGFGHFAFERVA